MKTPQQQQPQDRQTRWLRGMEHLVAVVQELSLARDMHKIMAIVRQAARQLVEADGATFILREEDKCYYADEDAISRLWKGQRFSINACIGGWCMLNRQQVMIEDVYEDDRIPIEAYRPTFVKSLVVVPIRTEDPIGAIATYWAKRHTATPEEVRLLQALADTTSVAIENVQVYAELEQRVLERTAQLEEANRELESFSYTLSHDLRAPLTVMKVLTGLLELKYGTQLDEGGLEYLNHLRSAIQRMTGQMDEMLSLYKVTRVDITPEVVDLSQIAQDIVADLQAAEPSRIAKVMIHEDLVAFGDPALLRVVLENLLSNAWKYSSKRSLVLVEFGALTQVEGTRVFYVRDNGAGFDMTKAEKLFTPFQRLHSEAEFPGHGVGLASVQRIIHRHGGSIWVDAAVEEGATFYFSLPQVGK